MFGFFNTASPEDKLRKDMRDKIEQLSLHSFKESGMMGTPFEGTMLMSSFAEIRDLYLKRSIAISEKYKVSRETTIRVINEVTDKLIKSYIKN